MNKTISILGSTGSIGTQTLEVIDCIGGIKVAGLSAYSNLDLFEQQIRTYHPKKVAIMKEELLEELKIRISDLPIEVYTGMEGLIEIATMEEIDTVVTAVIGTIGILPTIKAIEAKKNIALANKETLVSAGQIVMEKAKEFGVSIYPVDSEHSAVFQSMQGNLHQEVEKIILTASGGPFRGKSKEELQEVTLDQALKHPNWTMGRKITIDSASLMNKGLEVIEAKWLFDLRPDQIEVVVHPQSIIHSMVEYVDGSVIAQLGVPDMKVPIQYALTYPNRVPNNFEKFSFIKYPQLTFQEPDFEAFPCLELAWEALEKGGTYAAVLNAANEAAVELFLNKKIHFLEIPKVIRKAMENHEFIENPTLDEIIYLDGWAKDFVFDSIIKG